MPSSPAFYEHSKDFPSYSLFPLEEMVNELQYSCWGNAMDRGAWWATIYGVGESDMTEHKHS